MALSDIQSNNKLIRFVDDFIIEWARDNRFSPYQGTAQTSIIRVFNELKSGGEQINLPVLTKLAAPGVGSGALVGNEERLDDYGMRAWIDWARNAVVMKKSERHKDSADAFGEVKPLLSTWADELRRDETIEALLAIPSESAPSGLGSDAGDRVNGIRYELATVAQKDTWNVSNSDRVLYGNSTANYNATHATALATIDAVADTYTASSLKLLAYVAKTASPKIKPFKTTVTEAGGREYYVAFSGSKTFRDLVTSLDTVDKDARAREGRGMDNNPLFQSGDEMYRGVIAVEVPEIDDFTTNTWTSLATAGTGGLAANAVHPVFFCGQQAAAMIVGQMPRPVFRKEDDYGFVESAGVEMAYGIAKIFKRHPKAGTALKQWGVVQGFFAATAT